MIIPSQFKPAWWLSNPHCQTIWQRFARRHIALAVRRERITLPDGDFLDVDWVGENHNAPLVLVLHGLAGSIESPYAQGIMQAIAQQGWRGALMHFRGCSGEINRFPRSYHSGDTGDLAFVVQELFRREPDLRLAAVGFSLGGNVLLKWLGETEKNNPLVCAVGVSVPMQLDQAAMRMGRGFSQFYQWWLLRSLIRSTEEKFRQMPSPIDLTDLDKWRTFWEFDDKVTAQLHGFKDAHDYYRKSSSKQYLHRIQVPTLIIHAIDDPFMTENVIPTPQEISPFVTLELSQQGGHVGFISGEIPGRAEHWLEKRIPEYLNVALASEAPHGEGVTTPATTS